MSITSAFTAAKTRIRAFRTRNDLPLKDAKRIGGGSWVQHYSQYGNLNQSYGQTNFAEVYAQKVGGDVWQIVERFGSSQDDETQKHVLIPQLPARRVARELRQIVDATNKELKNKGYVYQASQDDTLKDAQSTLMANCKTCELQISLRTLEKRLKAGERLNPSAPVRTFMGAG